MTNIKIMIVEDDLLFQKIWDDVLVEGLFKKIFVGDGKEALKVYKFWKPDIILLDLMLPVMTGYSLLKEIREGIGDHYTTIIIQTSDTNREDILKCADLGIEGYIIKPFDAEEGLLNILKYYESRNPQQAKALELEYEKILGSRHLVQPSLTESFTRKESEYLEEIRLCLDDGIISDEQRRVLEHIEGKLGITLERAIKIENSVREEHLSYSIQELEYIEELLFCLGAGSISDDVRRLLDRIGYNLKLTKERADELEKDITYKEKEGESSSLRLLKKWQQAMGEQKEKKKAVYSSHTRFDKGDLIEHQIMGAGVVEKIISEKKIEVLFKGCLKVLMQEEES